jgi:hypothetical protein
LYSHGEVMIISGKIFTQFGVVISFSLRYLGEIGWTGQVRLTIISALNSSPEPLCQHKTLFEFVHIFAHRKESLVRFSDLGERIQECIRDIVDDSTVLIRARRVCNVLMHMNVLEYNEPDGDSTQIKKRRLAHSVDSKNARNRVLR